MATDPPWTWQEYQDLGIGRWLHAFEHLTYRKGLAKGMEGAPESWMFWPECWMFADPPDWAEEVADSGAPGKVWCPILNPGLTVDTPDPRLTGPMGLVPDR